MTDGAGNSRPSTWTRFAVLARFIALWWACTLVAGLYVVGGEDRDTHDPHDMDEVYYALRGRGVLRIEGDDTPIQAGSIVYVAAHRKHFFHTIEEELTLLVFFARASDAATGD